MYRTSVIVLCLVWTTTVVGSNVYRCEGEDGSMIFSQQPCADDADRVELENGSEGMGESAIESAETDTEIRAVCRQAVLNLESFMSDRAEVLAAEGREEAAAMLRAGFDESEEMRSEGIEECVTDWSTARYREGWQCMAGATTSSERQECLATELGQLLGPLVAD